MIRTLLKLAVFVVIALLGYNYFFGTADEKEQSRVIVGKAKDLGKDAWNLLRNEKSKMDEGKYDDALDKLENLYGKLENTARDLKDSEALDQLSRLNERRRELEEALGKGQNPTAAEERELEDLAEDTEVLMNEMEEKERAGAPY